MNLIDAIYIHEAGGKELLKIIIEKIEKDKFYFLLDSRLDLPKRYIESIKYKVIRPSEKTRKQFYNNNVKSYNKVICLSNVPPPRKIGSKVYIYFHNDLLLTTRDSKQSLISSITLWLKQKYIISKNFKNYIWVVQTNLMKDNLNKFIIKGKNKIVVFPIFRDQVTKAKNKKTPNTYLCVSNHNKHKNIINLLSAFKLYSSNQIEPIDLNLTIEKDYFNRYLEHIIPKGGSVSVNNHGQLEKNELNKLYKKSKYYIYPSLKESLGITLIEATSYGCDIICSDLEYSYQVVSPSLVFDPNSVKSIYSAILKSKSDKSLIRSKLMIKNKSDKFIEYIN